MGKFGNPFKIVKTAEELIEDGTTASRWGKRTEKGIKEGEEIYEVAANAFALEHGFASAGHMAQEIKSLRASVDELIDAQKGFKLSNMGKTGEQLIEAEGEAAEDISSMSKFLKSPIGRAGKSLGKTAWKYKMGIMKLGVLGGGAGYLYNEYALPEYDELKRDCQCTCQGFNKLTLNDENLKKVTNRIIELGDKKEKVTAEDLPYIISDVINSQEFQNKVKIESYLLNHKKGENPSAEVEINIDGKKYAKKGTGDGQFDAFINAIKKIYSEKIDKTPTSTEQIKLIIKF